MTHGRISRIPPGSQDLLADAVRHRRRIQRSWFEVAEAAGYAEVIPPTFEYEEVFTLGAGADLSRRLIRFLDRDGRVVALRADFTSAIARLAATKLAGEDGPLRLSYAGKVYRQEAEGRGRLRELFQLGAELLGVEGVEGDAEVLRLATSTLRALDLSHFQLNLGETRFLRPLLAAFPSDEARRVRAAVDRKDRAALVELAGRLGRGDPVRRALETLPELVGRGEVLARARTLACGDEAAAAVDRLVAIHEMLSPQEHAHTVYDLGEVRGLDYYSGIQFEVFVAGRGAAVGFGGRYDGLLGQYGRDRPAVGCCLELDALADLIRGAT